MKNLIFLLYVRPLQYKFIAFLAFALFLLLGCDNNEIVQKSDKTFQTEEELELFRQRSENFGHMKPVEVINPFSSRKVEQK